MSVELKEKIYTIFNDIQTRTDTKENMDLLCSLFESHSSRDINIVMENIFLMIFSTFDKNSLPLKNIREFLKSFIEKIIKNQKLKKQTSSFLNYFCLLFSLNGKKMKYKYLSLYFLSKYTTYNITYRYIPYTLL